MKPCVKALLSVILLVELSHSIPLTGELECPQCMHAGYKLINIPLLISSQATEFVGNLLGRYNNTSCEGNTVNAEICPIRVVNGTRACETFTSTSTVVGINLIIAGNLTDAGVEISVVYRSCGILNDNETPKCTPMSVDEAKQKVKRLSYLAQFIPLFQKHTFDAQLCQSAEGSVTPQFVTDTTTIVTTSSPRTSEEIVTGSTKPDSVHKTFDNNGYSGNSLSLASTVIVICSVLLRFYDY